MKYPIGIQSFEKLRQGGYLYIDKTAFIAKMLSNKGCYFLSRPRRFGKSLLLSTIEAFYRGKKELFEGLEISKFTTRWETHPVLHLDLNNRNYSSVESLTEELNATLEVWESEYGDEKRDRAVEERFAYVIRKAYEKTGRRVVILVDEYDKPLLNAVGNEALADELRGVLKAFYSNLKTMDSYIDFAMLTGVARFSKVSIFSDLNNLRDITFSDAYASVCGITDAELDAYLGDGVEQLACNLGRSVGDVRQELRRRYDGYRFAIESPAIYNPYSLMNVFEERRFGSYWFATGTPTHLVQLLQKGKWQLPRLAEVRIKLTTLQMAGIMTDDPVPVLYQCGYLTIKGYNEMFDQLLLGYPNDEVKEGFMEFLLPYYIKGSRSQTEFDISEFVMSIQSGDVDGFMELLGGLVAKVPYSDKGAAPESHFQNVLYILFTLIGLYARVEERISNGRIDMVVQTSERIYIFEFKVDRSASVALAQIVDKDYAAPYISCGKEIVLIGANFSSKERRLDEWEISVI